MFINHIFYKQVEPAFLNQKEISVRHKRYFDDLCRLYGMRQELNVSMKIVSYDDLASHLFSDSKNQAICAKAGYLLFPSWGYVLDTQSAIPELALQNQYGWSAPIVDVKDCGSLCVFYALRLMLDLSTDLNSDAIACCTIENAVPVWGSHIMSPKINYVALLSVSKNKPSCVKLISCDIFSISSHDFILFSINQKIKEQHISEKQCVVLFRNTIIDSNLKYHIENFQHPESSGFFYYMLYQIQHQKKFVNFSFAFIVDQDFQTECCAIAQLYIGGSHANAISRTP